MIIWKEVPGVPGDWRQKTAPNSLSDSALGVFSKLCFQYVAWEHLCELSHLFPVMPPSTSFRCCTSPVRGWVAQCLPRVKSLPALTCRLTGDTLECGLNRLSYLKVDSCGYSFLDHSSFLRAKLESWSWKYGQGDWEEVYGSPWVTNLSHHKDL